VARRQASAGFNRDGQLRFWPPLREKRHDLTSRNIPISARRFSQWPLHWHGSAAEHGNSPAQISIIICKAVEKANSCALLPHLRKSAAYFSIIPRRYHSWNGLAADRVRAFTEVPFNFSIHLFRPVSLPKDRNGKAEIAFGLGFHRINFTVRFSSSMKNAPLTIKRDIIGDTIPLYIYIKQVLSTTPYIFLFN